MRRLVPKTALLVGAFVAMLVLMPSPGRADIYRWCAYYAGRNGGGTNCYFLTYQQCSEALSGNGGYCGVNPMYDGLPPASERRYFRRP